MIVRSGSSGGRFLRHSNENQVWFKNVAGRYSYPDTITVDYLLASKFNASPKDYVGIYPRGWKDLKHFVGFENAQYFAPSGEPNLFRSLKINCVPAHVAAKLYEDYQFVYVDQKGEVLGRSRFFQFYKGNSDVAPVNFSNDLLSTNNPTSYDGEDDSVNSTIWSNVDYESVGPDVTPLDVLYNKVVFAQSKSHTSDTLNEGATTVLTRAPAFMHAKDVACRDYGEATTASFPSPKGAPITREGTLNVDIAKETSSSQYIPDKSSSTYFNNQRKGRALVKTRDKGQLECLTTSPEPPTSMCSNIMPFSNCDNDDLGSDFNYSVQWLQFHCASSLVGQSDPRLGAVPKRCHKCDAPYDWQIKSQWMHHAYNQADEQIRDLKRHISDLENILELHQAAHTKLKVLNNIAVRERDDAVNYANKVMSAIAQEKASPMNSNSNKESGDVVTSGWLVHHGQPRSLFLVRPNVGGRMFSGRDKLLKAMIGRQEETIQDLYAKLCNARKIIEEANLANYGLNVEVPNDERDDATKSSQMKPRSLSDVILANKVSVVEGPDVSKATEDYPRHEETFKQGVEEKNGFEDAAIQSSDSFEKNCLKYDEPDTKLKPCDDALIVEPKYYHLDQMQTSDCEVLLEDDLSLKSSEVDMENSLNQIETNNNNYDSKDMNSGMKPGELKCAVCEPAMVGALSTMSIHFMDSK